MDSKQPDIDLWEEIDIDREELEDNCNAEVDLSLTITALQLVSSCEVEMEGQSQRHVLWTVEETVANASGSIKLMGKAHVGILLIYLS